MPQELSYVIITPYTFRKARYGGIIARLLSRTDLELAGAQILAPDEAFTERYAALMEANNSDCGHDAGKGLGTYIRRNFAPVGGKKQRIMLLLLSGRNALKKTHDVVGGFSPELPGDAMTIRDTYADTVFKEDGTPVYCEPAVLMANNRESLRSELNLIAEFAGSSSNIVENILKNDDSKERTLVILKPENWHRQSTRPGAIMDIFTNTGLRLVGCKMHRISVAEALDFYGPVQDALRSKIAPKIAEKAKKALEEKLDIRLRPESEELLCKSAGMDYADSEFYKIIEFMSGINPQNCPGPEKEKPGKAKCMVLIYEGTDAVPKIRTVLGPTDSSKAPGGTVRGEFGTDMMVNSAHASDSEESYIRESGILKANENTLASIINQFSK